MAQTNYLEALKTASPGDVLGFAAPDCPGRTIRLCAGGPLNHVISVGPLWHREHRNHGRIELADWPERIAYESTASLKQPCLYLRQPVKGAQAHPLMWRVHYAIERGHKVWLYKLIRPLSEREQEVMLLRACKLLGTPYDYWGAWLARQTLVRCLTRHIISGTIEPSRLYCSEFVQILLAACNRSALKGDTALAPSPLMAAQVRAKQHRQGIELVQET